MRMRRYGRLKGMDKRNRNIELLLATAFAEEGYLEKSRQAYLDDPSCLDQKEKGAGFDNYTKYGRDMHELCPDVMDFPAPWCDAFVDWCFYKTFGLENAKHLLGGFDDYTVNSAHFYQERDQWYETDPKAGDQVFFRNEKRICHTGIVYQVDEDYIYVIEGNARNDSTIENEGGVVKTVRSKTDPSIAGYGRPDYCSCEAL